MPAMLAYHGRSFYEFLILIGELGRYTGKRVPWVILSAKYGFLNPSEAIEDYDITFGQQGSISDEKLAEQAERKEINGRTLSSFKRVYVYASNPTYYEKACRALRNAETCIQISGIYNISHLYIHKKRA